MERPSETTSANDVWRVAMVILPHIEGGNCASGTVQSELVPFGGRSAPRYSNLIEELESSLRGTPSDRFHESCC